MSLFSYQLPFEGFFVHKSLSICVAPLWPALFFKGQKNLFVSLPDGWYKIQKNVIYLMLFLI